MVLGEPRYFQLLDYIVKSSSESIDIDDIVCEISQEKYEAGKATSPHEFVCATEVVFDAKGKTTNSM